MDTRRKVHHMKLSPRATIETPRRARTLHRLYGDTLDCISLGPCLRTVMSLLLGHLGLDIRCRVIVSSARQRSRYDHREPGLHRPPG